MHTNFSLQRIKLLLLADKTELFRQYFLSMLSYIAVTITYLMIVKFVFHNEQQVEQKVYFFYRIGLLLFFLFFLSIRKSKSTSNQRTIPLPYQPVLPKSLPYC